MSFETSLADALSMKPGAIGALAAAPTSEWMANAAFVRAALSEPIQPRDWQRIGGLQSVVRLPAGRAFVRFLLEPDSEQLALGLTLARSVGPDDELEERLRELEQTPSVTEALRAVDGGATIHDLSYWMGKPFTADYVIESLQPSLDDLSRLPPRQLGRFAPRLVDLIQNWNSVVGVGSEETATLYRALERADLSSLIAAFQPHFETQREHWLATMKELYFLWPSSAKWAQNVIDYFEPTNDDDAEDDAPPPAQAEVFRRKK